MESVCERSVKRGRTKEQGNDTLQMNKEGIRGIREEPD
jgi:hypothetical protein